MQAIGRYCSQLQCLNLGWCEDVSDVGVMSLAYGCPDLRTVDLCGCLQITGILVTVPVPCYSWLWQSYFSNLVFAHVCTNRCIARESMLLLSSCLVLAVLFQSWQSLSIINLIVAI